MQQAFGIVIERGKCEHNLGGIIRSAICFGASFVGIVGGRYKKQAQDTTAGHKTIPVFSWKTWDDYRESCPYAWAQIAVELCCGAKDLHGFSHPRNAVYLLGPEDGSLSKQAMDIAESKVIINTKFCLNQHVAASIVMYDRVSKTGQRIKTT